MHLLLVEDDERLARALTRLLEEDRHVVEHAPDGRTGIELAGAIDGLDAVILDIGLPDMSGLDVARRLRRDQVDVSILMLTARDTVNDRVTGPRRRRRRLRRQAVRVPGGRGAPARAGPSRRARAAPPGSPPRGGRDHPRRGRAAGDRQRPQRRPQPARVLAARGADAASRPDADARPAARPRLAVQRRGHAQRRRRLRPLPADQARRGRARRWRPSEGWATGSAMADGGRLDPRDDDAEQAALADEAKLIRRVRWRLVAWSGISTLVVLVILGAALYAAVANSLEAASVQQLENRARPFVALLEGPNGDTGNGPEQGFVFGGGNTVLYIFDANGAPVQVGDRPVVVPTGLPEEAGLTAAAASADGTDIRTATLEFAAPFAGPPGSGPGTTVQVPVRVLTHEIVAQQDGNTYYLQVLQDRSTEVETLQALLTVLLVGGVLVVRRRGRVRLALRAARAGADPGLVRAPSGRPCAASASSPPTPRTSCARR